MADIEPKVPQGSAPEPSASKSPSPQSRPSSASSSKVSDSASQISRGIDIAQGRPSEGSKNDGVQDVEDFTNGALSIAQTGVEAVKTVAQAASGDIPGAISTVLQNEKLRKGAGVSFLYVIISTCTAFFILYICTPLALYEGVQAYQDTFHDTFYETYYSSDDNRVFAALEATVKGLGVVIEDIWNSITEKRTMNDAETKDADIWTEDDLTLMGKRDAAISVYDRKLCAIIDKLDSRAKAIIAAAQSSAQSSVNNTGTLNGAVYEYKFLADKKALEELDDAHDISYGGLNIAAASQPLSKRDAIKVLALYSTQYSIAPKDIEPYSLMKWLGYYTLFADSVSFTVGDKVTLSIDGWEGDCLPQYLLEESLRNTEGDYDEYRCPAADLLLVVNTPSIDSLTPIIENKEVTVETLEQTETWEWKWLKDTTYERLYKEDSLSAPTPTEEKPDPKYDTEGWDWYFVKNIVPHYEFVEETKFDYTISYTMNLTVSLRSIDEIAEMLGLYQESK